MTNTHSSNVGALDSVELNAAIGLARRTGATELLRILLNERIRRNKVRLNVHLSPKDRWNV